LSGSDDRFLALMARHLPAWRQARAELNAAPLAAESWAVDLGSVSRARADERQVGEAHEASVRFRS